MKLAWRAALAILIGLGSPPLAAGEPLILSARGSVAVAFTPGDDAAGLVVKSISQARQQILVQSYSLTHKGIAEALVAAKRRGVEVAVIADRYQAETGETSLVDWLAAQGVPVWLDGEHAAAHNKVMVLDAGTPQATLITGSFNFTHAAQYRNAENLLVFKGNLPLAEAYAANWRRHRIHSQRLAW
jgi:phosphatidylserine/phosphatidylglycerophosphate/cardiolipin synthase-like enzyme